MMTEPRNLTPVELHARIRSGAPPIIVDVREHAELATGMVPGARHIPRSRVEVEVSAAFPDRGAEIVLVCASGMRSRHAATLLQGLGYSASWNLLGGMKAWTAADLPVVLPADDGDGLSAEARARYARHLSLPQVGVEGQKKLGRARVLVVGAGGLGSPVVLYLAAAGVGRMTVLDDDRVDASNLQRQVVHRTVDQGTFKADSAARAVRDLNPLVDVVPLRARLTRDNAPALFKDHDVVVDGTDNLATRYLLCDAGILFGKPVVHGSIWRFEGQVTTLAPHLGGPSYRCLFPQPPPPHMVPSCAEGGVLGVLPGIVGTLQALEVLKLVCGMGEPLLGRLLQVDALSLRFRELRYRRDPRWPVGEAHPDIRALDVDHDAFCRGGGAP